MNFEIVSIQRLKVGIDFYFRVYSVMKKKNGLLRIRSLINGKILFDNLNPNDILINGNPMQSLQELQEVIYNSKCDCTGEEDEYERKIFDLTFDPTFE